jgi:serine/threonine protein kinase
LGRYELLKKLGEGGMAEVFLATPRDERRLVAIKLIRKKLAGQSHMVDLFMQEGDLAARLKHKNIVEAFETGQTNGLHFICMEYVAGVDLSSLLRQVSVSQSRSLPAAIAVDIAEQICAGLHHAHELRDEKGRLLNVVNRDIDPSNIRITFNGAVKLLDFGIARAATGQRSEIGEVKGKFSYMSPEQARCMPVDRRSDIFSVGVVLHEMLTGKRLFRGQEVFDTLDRVKRAEVLPPSRVNTQSPVELDAIVLKALSRDREERYETAREFKAALHEVTPLMPPARPLAAMVREACQTEFYRASRLRRAFIAGEPLPGEGEDTGRYGSVSGVALIEEQPPETSNPEAVVRQRESASSPTWMYWMLVPVLALFGAAVYLVLRG